MKQKPPRHSEAAATAVTTAVAVTTVTSVSSHYALSLCSHTAGSTDMSDPVRASTILLCMVSVYLCSNQYSILASEFP